MEESAKRRRGDRARSMEESAKRRRVCGNDGTTRGASSSGYDYEVFLSFRGPDTRAGFADFLYTSMIAAGIRAYRDDEELRIGGEIGPELLQAINRSKISIPIFSKGYASSEWCLKELVQMVECHKKSGQKIMPIFYDVAPSEVRHQIGYYGEAFRSHEDKQRCDEETMRQWKAALDAVGAIRGWDLHSKIDRREGEFAKEVTEEVFRELKKHYLVVPDCLVSVDNHVDAIMDMIGAQTSETRIIGIHGMGGIGKTTIAKIIYNQLSSNFKDRCFLSNIRETSDRKGIECLQNQLISDILKTKQTHINNVDEGTQVIKNRLSNKRVLLLLDDVENVNHIDALVGKCDWLGRGSKIIITTRNRDTLYVPEVDHSYELSGMDCDQSLELFSKHAFRRDSPLDEYIDQSYRAIGIAGGLPLALEVIGSLLSRTEKEKWDGKLNELENVPPQDVQSKLKISYDALRDREQQIFLDIACLYIGHDKDIVVHFWESSLFPKEAMHVLESMSLIKIEADNRLWMHDQLRDLGREMVRQESGMRVQNQSRVWDTKEALYLFRKHQFSSGQVNKVEALRVKFDDQHRYCFTYESFNSLSNLRFLEMDSSVENFHAEESFFWHKSPSHVFQTNENSDLLPQLQWLSWHKIPTTFNIAKFSMEGMLVLDLSWSDITDDWKGWSHLKVMKKLKVLNLSNCQRLKRTPNFSAYSNLQRLTLHGCESLTEIDESICQLQHLVSLDLSCCGNLQRLPDELGGDLASLDNLSLSWCRSLERLPDTIGNLELLSELDISHTSIKEIPDSIGKLKYLRVVKMWNIDIRKIPDAFWTIDRLEKIEGYCKNFHRVHVKIGNCISENQFLRILRLKRANIYAVPRLPESLIRLELSELCMDTFPDLSNLTDLRELDLWFGSSDYDGKSYGPVEDPIPRWIVNLSKLESLNLVSPYVTTLPADLNLPPQLKSLHLACPNLHFLPRLPSSLSSLHLEHCKSLSSMDLSKLKKLSSLNITSAVITEIQGLGCLENLQCLQLNSLGQVEILTDLSNLNRLKSLIVLDCGNLVEIRGKLPQFLDTLQIFGCGSLQKLPDLSNLKELLGVDIQGCVELKVEALLDSGQVNLSENL